MIWLIFYTYYTTILKIYFSIHILTTFLYTYYTTILKINFLYIFYYYFDNKCFKKYSLLKSLIFLGLKFILEFSVFRTFWNTYYQNSYKICIELFYHFDVINFLYILYYYFEDLFFYTYFGYLSLYNIIILLFWRLIFYTYFTTFLYTSAL